MSFVKKLKDILFDEEDVTEPIKINDDVNEEEPKIVKIEPIHEEESIRETIVEKEFKEEPKKVENTFQFPDFDEEEFSSSISKSHQNVNVMDYPMDYDVDYNMDYSVKKPTSKLPEYRPIEKVETKEVFDRKKFKPSPIISPVYGILNQDYKAEDIVNREDVASNITIEEVRKKAFETPVKEKVVEEKVEETISEPVVTFFEEKDAPVPTREEKANYKSIDDLLEEASTEIPLEDTIEIPKTNNLDAIEEELEKLDTEVKEDTKEIQKEIDDTLDSDLFELIDSMYDDRKESE